MTKLTKILVMAFTTAAIAVLAVMQPAPASAQSSDKVYNWRFGIYFPSLSSLEGQHATEFVQAVRDRSDGRLLIKIFPGGMLGFSSFTHHRVVGDGLLEMGTTMSAAMIEAPEFEALSHVLLFTTREEAQQAFDMARPALERASLAKFNSKLLGALVPEFDHMFSKVPLATVADWKLFNPKYFEVAFKAWYEELG